tara:strand:- start:84 stop:686 length:603 start_codon:yes stop_codon:yes gene_type:complete
MRFNDYAGARQGVFAASFINVLAWLLTAGVLIAGLVLLMYEDPSAGRYDSFFERRPLALTGVIMAVAGFTQMMIVIMVANFIKATLAFQAEAGTFFAAFKRGLDVGLDPRQAIVHGTEPAKAELHSPSSHLATEEQATETSDRSPRLHAVPVDKIKSGTPSDHDYAPGWYEDPDGGDFLRWWEGKKLKRWSQKKARPQGG